MHGLKSSLAMGIIHMVNMPDGNDTGIWVGSMCQGLVL